MSEYQAAELIKAKTHAMAVLVDHQELLLPWPPKVLSPNARAHWATRSRAAKNYRAKCHWIARRCGLTAPAGRLLLVIEFLPPNRRRRDDDNLIAAFKSGRDGLADALGVDDSLFVTQCMLSDEVRPGGAVRVTFKPYRVQLP